MLNAEIYLANIYWVSQAFQALSSFYPSSEKLHSVLFKVLCIEGPLYYLKGKPDFFFNWAASP